jgi:hypothetical protein
VSRVSCAVCCLFSSRSLLEPHERNGQCQEGKVTRRLMRSIALVNSRHHCVILGYQQEATLCFMLMVRASTCNLDCCERSQERNNLYCLFCSAGCGFCARVLKIGEFRTSVAREDGRRTPSQHRQDGLMMDSRFGANVELSLPCE